MLGVRSGESEVVGVRGGGSEVVGVRSGESEVVSDGVLGVRGESEECWE